MIESEPRHARIGPFVLAEDHLFGAGSRLWCGSAVDSSIGLSRDLASRRDAHLPGERRVPGLSDDLPGCGRNPELPGGRRDANRAVTGIASTEVGARAAMAPLDLGPAPGMS